MTFKPNLRDVLWMSAGAGLLLAVVLVLLFFHEERDFDTQRASKAARVECVDQMRAALTAASEAEKSAVLAVTDEDSQMFADRARAATAEVERGRSALAKLLEKHGARGESELLEQFASDFVEFRRVDGELLALAVKNTNLKAYALTYGAATDALEELDSALSRFVERSAVRPDANEVVRLAFVAQNGALRIHTRLPRHIAEESDAKMDDIEARMALEDRNVVRALEGMATLHELHGDPDFDAATASYARLCELRARIIALSRENTNVRSLSMSLNQKRKVALLCQEALTNLRQAIVDEPDSMSGVEFESKPR